MNEQLLQFIWQFQYFNRNELTTFDDEPLQIVYAGTLNSNQGADFTNAKIKIGKTTWAGSIEIHLKSSDWQKHNHSGDKNYQNVILHVVYEHDILNDEIPVLELKTRISRSLLSRYKDLMQSQSFIACEKMIAKVPQITVAAWKERLMAERLTRKSDIVYQCLKENNFHWEETFWWLLARNFGMKVNADAFEAVAKSVSVNILAKHKNQLQQLEALLLGQAGLLKETFNDPYAVLLQKEYKFLSNKYALKPIDLPVHFLRMRPGNFPTIRLAQLAALIQNSVHLFSKILEETSIDNVKKMFKAEANDFWNYHYRLNDESDYKKKTIGSDMVDNILINTIAIMLFAHGDYYQNLAAKDKALKWLEEVKAEKNSITKGFQAIGVENKTSFDSQSLLELKTQYCNKKSCLQCSIGSSLLKM